MRQVKAKDTVMLSKEAFEDRGNTRLYWLGGAGFLLNVHGTILLVDPVLTTKPGERRCETGSPMLVDYPIDAHALPRVDLVLYTHSDADHLGPVTAPVLFRHNPLFIGTLDVREALERLLGKRPRFLAGKADASFGVANVEVTLTPADHPWQLLDPGKYGKILGPDDCCGFQIATPDGVMLFMGDTRLMQAHLSIEGVDVLALDVSRCTYHLGVAGATVMANTLKDALLVPYHYGTYDLPDAVAHNGDPDDVLQNVVRADARVRRLAPGECLVIRRDER